MSSYTQSKEKAEEIIKKFNPESLSPFPYENIQREYKNLKIFIAETPEKVSGVILFSEENNEFLIVVNKEEPKTRQHFTLAHELGHFFLHEQYLKKKTILIDGVGNVEGNRALYREDEPDPQSLEMEKEANNFAANLIMPEKLVKKAWEALEDIQECAKIFHVSPSAMSIRLEKLKIINVF